MSKRSTKTKPHFKPRRPVLMGKRRCKACGFLIRGPHHNEGEHHRAGGMANVIKGNRR